MNAEAARVQAGTNETFHVAAGDSLRVEYFYNEELNRDLLVRPDGCVTLPLLGDVKAAGETIPDLNKVLAKRYEGILKHPDITVSLVNAGSYKVFVGGEVRSPGVFALSDGVTALRAIALAGGALNTGTLSSVMVIRDQGTATPEYLLVDLNSDLGQFNSEDLQLRPKDMVYVPKSKIAKINQFVDQYANQLIPFQKSLNVSYLFGRTSY